jgi:enoyl-CoA hydratase/carnithine racemase
MPNALIAEDDGIVTVTFDRDEKLNAIDSSMTAALWEAATALADRDDLRCMVITAKGRYFSAGIDLNDPVGNRPGSPATEGAHRGWNFRRNYRSHHLLYDEFEAIEKPIILAAQGHCLGAGLEMAASCDFRFCTPETQFALPEVRIGVMAGSGGTSRLTRLVGPGWGKWLAMAGQRVAGPQALQIGLVHDVFAADVFMERVYAFCRDLITIPAEVLGVTKLAVDICADVQDRTVQRHLDRIIVTGIMDSPEFVARTERYRRPAPDPKSPEVKPGSEPTSSP